MGKRYRWNNIFANRDQEKAVLRNQAILSHVGDLAKLPMFDCVIIYFLWCLEGLLKPSLHVLALDVSKYLFIQSDASYIARVGGSDD